MKIQWPVWLSRNVIGFSIASIMSDANHEIVPLILPAFIGQLVASHTAPELVALISGISTSAASITSLYAGNLSDQLSNRKPLILFGYFLTGTFVGLIAFAYHWITVALFMLGAWIGRGLVSAPRNAIIADSTPADYYGHAFGFRQALDTIGSVIGPLIVYLFASWPLHAIFLIAFIPGLFAVLIVYLFVQDVPREVKEQTNPFSLLFIFRDSLPKAFKYLLGVFFLFGLGSFNKTLLVLRMQEVLAIKNSAVASLSMVALLYIFRNIVQTGASYIMGAISDRIGRVVPLAFFGFGLFSIMALLLAWISPSLPLALLVFFLSGFSAGTYMSLQKSLAADLLPEEVRGTGYGILKTVDSLGTLSSSLIIGVIWSNVGPQYAFISAAGISLISSFILMSMRNSYPHLNHDK